MCSSDLNDFEDLLPLASKEVKGNKAGVEFDKAVFKLFFTGVPTNRDEWVFDLNKESLSTKMKFFSEKYNLNIGKDEYNNEIKWSRDLKNELNRGNKSVFSENLIVRGIYRPFFKTFHYTEKLLNDVLTQNHYDVFGKDLSND